MVYRGSQGPAGLVPEELQKVLSGDKQQASSF